MLISDSRHDTAQAVINRHWRFRDGQEVISRLPIDDRKMEALTKVLFFSHRGSNFLKKWMEFLEENADLRYPDATEVSRE